jgi:DNA-binding helix-hairpin-helix protein with protein kinase domain
LSKKLSLTSLTTSDNKPLTIGTLVGKGGEGEVREVHGFPDLVAKLYLAPMSPERQRKLAAMVARQSPALTAIAAWPTALIHHPSKDGPVVGFLMPRLGGHKELHKLSHPMDRLRTYPEVGYDFLVHVATNIARAFDTLHRSGIVVGDVNESGVMVKGDGTVMFIDCDSMQLEDGGTTYTCDVGKPEFQPPEILQKTNSFRGLLRTPDNDAFGLGVLIFQLLFFGWHPFAVRMLDGEQEPTADNIKKGRFAFGRNFYVVEFRRPPHALDPSWLPDPLRDLIERAFVPSGARPTGHEWVLGLEALAAESVVCSRYMTHVHHRSALRCPFCELDLKLGFAILPHIAFDANKLKEVWQHIQSAYFELSSPTPAPDVPLPEAPPVPDELVASAHRVVNLTRLEITLALLSLGLAAVTPLALLGLIAVLPLELIVRRGRPSSYHELARRTRKSRNDFALAEAALSPPREPGVIVNFDDAKTAYERLLHHDERRHRQLFKTHENLIERQTRAYLSEHRLRKAGLGAIPGAIVIALEKKGYDTAADVVRLREKRPRGIEPSHVSALTRWEFSLLNRFTPDLESADYLAAIEQLHRDLDTEHAHLMQRLVLGRDWLEERRRAHCARQQVAVRDYIDRWNAHALDLAHWNIAKARLYRR